MLTKHVEREPSLLSYTCRRTLRVGGISSLLSASSPEDVLFGPGLEPFSDDIGDADIRVSVEWQPALRAISDQQVFDSGAVWTVARDGADFVFDFSSAAISPHPYKRLMANESFTRTQLLLSHEVLDAHCPIFPLEYPTDELLITNYLAAHGLGIEVHGCGLIDAEMGGHLLLGHSGAGKSTTAGLWHSLRRPEILSDDRIILRIENGELWMHGTPWHGEGRFAAPGSARVNNIFVLRHGERNEFTEYSRSHAAGELFARSFPPFHSPPGLERTIEFLDRVVAMTPCYEFSFVPDTSAVNAVLEFSYVAAHC